MVLGFGVCVRHREVKNNNVIEANSEIFQFVLLFQILLCVQAHYFNIQFFFSYFDVNFPVGNSHFPLLITCFVVIAMRIYFSNPW